MELLLGRFLFGLELVSECFRFCPTFSISCLLLLLAALATTSPDSLLLFFAAICLAVVIEVEVEVLAVVAVVMVADAVTVEVDESVSCLAIFSSCLVVIHPGGQTPKTRVNRFEWIKDGSYL